MADACRSNDLAGGGKTFLISWGVPIVAFIIGGSLPFMPRTIVWSAALLWAGGACLLNAYRCRRLHCFIAGPLYVLAAGAIILDGLDLIALDPKWPLYAVGLGTFAGCALECVKGKRYASPASG